ncbi:hypothetical protein [Pedosphaera parvula]|uniref:Uncharacterized protein n=1 Tax=Pedosphaera parvula (strain Ellin514) TaxID=320771 RepID=B9XRP3_PEDPL|nr:hypothetical protein [Pedosphaera parvula]EEF57514.1 hypothetical protein Cflav_PD0445 [Pedosphaera parvula Ellin514]
MVTTDWQWWTYIKVGDYVARRGCILEFDYAARWIRYQKVINFPKDGIVDRGVFEGTFDGIWVDPERSFARPQEVIEALDRGVVPSTFAKLEDRDPRDYFRNERTVLASYFPANDASQSNE